MKKKAVAVKAKPTATVKSLADRFNPPRGKGRFSVNLLGPFYHDVLPKIKKSKNIEQDVFDWVEACRAHFASPERLDKESKWVAGEKGGEYCLCYLPISTIMDYVRVYWNRMGISMTDSIKINHIISEIYAKEIEYVKKVISLNSPIRKRVVCDDAAYKKTRDAMKNESTETRTTVIELIGHKVEPVVNTEPKKEKKEENSTTTKGGIPVTERGKRKFVWEFPMTDIMKWMGSQQWGKPVAEAALKKLGIEANPSTLNVQMLSGRTGEKGSHGPPPKLSKQQEALLNQLK